MVRDKYKKLDEISQSAKDLIGEGLEKRNKANRLIKLLKTKIARAKDEGINTFKAERILKKAEKIKEDVEEIKDYDKVIKYVKLARDTITKLEEEYNRQKKKILEKATISPDKIHEVATLSLSKRGNEYEVGFKFFKEKGKASKVFEFIKVSPESRIDIINQINSVVTLSNLLIKSRGNLNHDDPELRVMKKEVEREIKQLRIENEIKFGKDEQIENLVSFGKLLYSMFLPIHIQKHMTIVNQPLILETNDNEIPWELLHDEKDFLCLKVPVSRRLRSSEVSRINPIKKSKNIKFLFITNPTSNLPGAEEEVRFIRNNLRPEIEVEMLQKGDATNAVILSAFRSGKYDVIHYAGHAVFNSASPDESALLVADDGRIYAQEIKRILGGRPFVFLNACGSGKEKICEDGKSYTGCDTEGLASSFILGGAMAIIGASWPTPDLSSGLIATEFYKNFIKGDSVGISLLKARNHFKLTRTEDINWAAFTLYGDPTLKLNKEYLMKNQ